MNTESTLKPCPFCGGPGKFFDGEQPPMGGHFVYCDAPSCQAQGRVSGQRDKAIAAWNRRAVKGGGWQPIETLDTNTCDEEMVLVCACDGNVTTRTMDAIDEIRARHPRYLAHWMYRPAPPTMQVE